MPTILHDACESAGVVLMPGTEVSGVADGADSVTAVCAVLHIYRQAAR